MKKVFKWIGIILVGLIGILAIAVAGFSISTNARLNKTYEVQPAAVSIPEDAAAIERGSYIYRTSCAGCHGEDLAGTPFFNDPVLGYIPASNLTAGRGGIGRTYSNNDFVRAIRHGIDADGKPLMIMPSKAFWHFSDEDLGAVIAYVKSTSPVDKDLGDRNLKLVGRVLLSTGAFGEVLAAEVLDHAAPRLPVVEQGVTAEYGEYLINTSDCRSCHGEALTGGQSSEPGAPPSPNLTSSGLLAIWSTADFIETMHTGVTPYGRKLDGNFMPYEEYGRMTDEDLTAMFLYLQSLPALETATE